MNQRKDYSLPCTKSLKVLGIQVSIKSNFTTFSQKKNTHTNVYSLPQS